MRYRRLRYRYTVLDTSEGLRRLSDQWHRGSRADLIIHHHVWRPSTDVYETERSIYVIADLAGINPEELDILLYEDALVIEGVRNIPLPSQEGFYIEAEIEQGPFRLECHFEAQHIDTENVEARYEIGLLKIILNKVQGEKEL